MQLQVVNATKIQRSYCAAKTDDTSTPDTITPPYRDAFGPAPPRCRWTVPTSWG